MIRVLGTNADHDTCNRCGKTGLKKVVWLEIDEGAPEPVGCDCAALLLRRSGRKVWSMAQEADHAKKEAEKRHVHQIGTERSMADFYIVLVAVPSGHATILARANGMRPAVMEWAAARFHVKGCDVIEVVAPGGMNFSKINW